MSLLFIYDYQISLQAFLKQKQAELCLCCERNGGSDSFVPIRFLMLLFVMFVAFFIYLVNFLSSLYCETFNAHASD